MANPFEVQVPNVLQTLMMFDQGYDSARSAVKERATSQARQQAAQELQGGGNPQSAIARLMSVGDVQGATAIANIGNNQRDFAFRQQEAQRAQSNADRSFNLQERTMAEAGRGFEHREVDDGSGGKTLVRINKATGAIDRPLIPGSDSTPTNPYAAGGKQTEGQANASLYANRMFEAEQVLRDPKVVAAATSAGERAIEGAPNTLFGLNVGLGAAKNALHSKEFQKFDQAQRNFINATLRRESGAVISDAEFDNARKQYFPQLGDTPEVLAQKQANRAEAIRGIAGAGGPNYRPPMAFADDGSLVPNPARKGHPAPRGAASSAPPAAAAALRANPSLRDQYEQKYGPGSAAQVLGR